MKMESPDNDISFNMPEISQVAISNLLGPWLWGWPITLLGCLHREARQRSTLLQLQRKQPQRHRDLAEGGAPSHFAVSREFRNLDVFLLPITNISD